MTSFLIFISFSGLSIYGLLFVYSSTIPTDVPVEEIFTFSSQLKKQAWFYGIGVAVLFGLGHIPYKRWMLSVPFLYFFNIFLLVLLYVPGIGTTAGGARSWLNLGFIRFQPSETMKIVWVLYLAYYLRYRKDLNSFSGLFIPFAITGFPLLFILAQPDLGTAFIFMPTLFLLLYFVGAKKRHLFIIIIAMMLVSVPVFKYGLKDYQKGRLLAFLSPNSKEYEKTYNYQPINSRLAIGDGHFLGKGLGKGLVNRLAFLPDRHTDFIFSVIAEELGFVGAVGLLLCYLTLLFAFILIALYTREPFGRTVVLGIGSLLGIQVFTNLGVALGLLPTTGVTLPFISAGGSSIVSCCVMVGLVLSISKYYIPVLSQDDFSH